MESIHIADQEVEFLKASESQRLIFGWAIVSKIKGKPHFDLQGDHIPEDPLLKASKNFAKSSRNAFVMHGGEKIGQAVFLFPLTTEIAKSMGIKTDKTGLLIAIEPESDEVLQKARDGELRGFSIGGIRVEDEEVDDS